jgi:hypothetical protein
MADNIVGNLFGVTPEMYQQQQSQLQDAKALQYAQLSPEQQAQYGFFRGGQQLGTAAAGLLGVEDPQLKMIRDVQAMRANYDVSTPAGLRSFAQALSNKGYTNFAMEAAKAADARDKQIAETGKLQQETKYIGREIKEIGVKGNPELVIKAAVDKDGNVIQTIGEPYSRFTAKTNINTGDKNVLEVDKKMAEDYLTQFQSAKKVLPRLDEMTKLVANGVVQGNLSEARQGFLSVMDAAGLNTKNASKVISNSEQFNKEVQNLVQGVIKSYGINPSNADLKATLASLPELSKTPEGLNKVLNSLIKVKRDEYNESKRALDYFRGNKGSFIGYEEKVPLLAQEQPAGKTITINKPLNQYSTQELQKLLDENK